ncbi:hypothetical protein CM15mP35_01730 [bacterium]|nr:MAG: hypothetical protein CM15mP35_01730 [bacterium]
MINIRKGGLLLEQLHLYIYGKQSIENKLYFLVVIGGTKITRKVLPVRFKKIISIKPKSLKNFYSSLLEPQVFILDFYGHIYLSGSMKKLSYYGSH